MYEATLWDQRKTVWRAKVMEDGTKKKTLNYSKYEWQIYEEEYDRKKMGGTKINRDIRPAGRKEQGSKQSEARVREKVTGWGAAAEGEGSLDKMKQRKEAVVWQGGDSEQGQREMRGREARITPENDKMYACVLIYL